MGTNVLGKTSFWPVSYQASSAIAAVAGINNQCIDGGFSYPHRTLGANMLKDQIWGIDFDGKPLAVGATRGTVLTSQSLANLVAAGFATPSGRPSVANTMPVGSVTATVALAGVMTENLDSVCMDCHGNATVYNPTTANIGTDPFGTGATGWELLLKGLP